MKTKQKLTPSLRQCWRKFTQVKCSFGYFSPMGATCTLRTEKQYWIRLKKKKIDPHRGDLCSESVINLTNIMCYWQTQSSECFCMDVQPVRGSCMFWHSSECTHPSIHVQTAYPHDLTVLEPRPVVSGEGVAHPGPVANYLHCPHRSFNSRSTLTRTLRVVTRACGLAAVKRLSLSKLSLHCHPVVGNNCSLSPVGRHSITKVSLHYHLAAGKNAYP